MSEKNKTIEQKMSELRTAVAWFESDEFSLDEATERYKAAAQLAQEIEKDLREMENSVNVLKESFEAA